jgi:GAF domain-containing protein
MEVTSRTITDLIEEIAALKGKIEKLEQSDRLCKEAEQRQQLTAEILGILNDPTGLTDAIRRILLAIKRETGFEAVGIRLPVGDDFPYFVQEGFSDEFLLAENSLVFRTEDGQPCRDRDGNLSLECTCGLVLSGKTDPSSPLFTPGGSAWTNNSLPILELPRDHDPRFNPRNRCIHEGFLSIALIPIRSDQEIIGLLQLNDRQADRLNFEMIQYLEGISASIGVALQRKRMEEERKKAETEREKVIEELQKALSKIKTLSGFLPICSACKKIRDDQGYWQQIESYIRDHSEAEFSHGICPDCAKKLYPQYIKPK